MRCFFVVLGVFFSSVSFSQNAITDTGTRVGIGDTTPSKTLDVSGDGRFTSYLTAAGFSLSNNGGGVIIEEIGNNIAFGDIDDTWSNVLFYGYGYEKMRMNASTGNFSIGNNNNFYKLDVNGTGRFSNTLHLNSGAEIAGSKTLHFDGFNDDYYIAANKNSYKLEIGRGNTVGANQVLVIDYNSKVGIGTTNPDEKLAVNGKIHAREVRVDLDGWSDFVFKNGYNLPSLEEVESYIKTKGHLNGIPSEKEVLVSGILLGEMNSKLLQKIEELTLYTIDQEKKLHDQKQQIQNQNELNEVLKARLTKLEEMMQVYLNKD